MNKNTFDWLRINHDNIKFYLHKNCDEKEVSSMLQGLSTNMVCKDEYGDGLAYVIDMRPNTVIYRMGDSVFIIPAKVKPLPTAVIDNNDGTKPKVFMEFEYPCEMRREDLVEY